MFLEDRQENTFTRLDNPNGNYKITQTSSANEVGRFTPAVVSPEFSPLHRYLTHNTR